MKEWIKKSDVLELLSLPSDILSEYIYELKGIWMNEDDDTEWFYLTDDGDSYPETFKYVLIEDDIGYKNVACCDPDYDWHISNGENSLKLIGEVVKWAYI